jgi:hypothetical protein
MREAQEESGIRRSFLLDTFLWRKNAAAFSAFTTSMWLDKQRKVYRPWVREPTLKSIVALATHYINVFILRQAQDERSLFIDFMVRQAHYERF